MDDERRDDVTIKVKSDCLYEPPRIKSYSEDLLKDFLGPAHLCSPFQGSCAFFSGAVVGC
jgi:hypothetical protein